MQSVLVRYKVKAERAAENERFIAAVFEELERLRPEGLRYASFKLGDGVSFVHVSSYQRADGHNPLLELPAFRAFVAEIKQRCEELPVTVDLHQIGAYAG